MSQKEIRKLWPYGIRKDAQGRIGLGSPWDSNALIFPEDLDGVLTDQEIEELKEDLQTAAAGGKLPNRYRPQILPAKFIGV